MKNLFWWALAVIATVVVVDTMTIHHGNEIAIISLVALAYVGVVIFANLAIVAGGVVFVAATVAIAVGAIATVIGVTPIVVAGMFHPLVTWAIAVPAIATFALAVTLGVVSFSVAIKEEKLPPLQVVSVVVGEAAAILGWLLFPGFMAGSALVAGVAVMVLGVQLHD